MFYITVLFTLRLLLSFVPIPHQCYFFLKKKLLLKVDTDTRLAKPQQLNFKTVCVLKLTWELSEGSNVSKTLNFATLSRAFLAALWSPFE